VGRGSRRSDPGKEREGERIGRGGRGRVGGPTGDKENRMSGPHSG
jgi:hypothetical protein